MSRRTAVARLGLLLLLAPALRAAPDPSSDCLVCHNNETFALRDADGRVRSMHVDPSRFYNSAHVKLGCAGCHGAMGPGPHGGPGGKAVKLPPEQQALLAGRAPSTGTAAAAACMSCHPEQARQFVHSVHGEALARGNRDVPLCHDCHGSHYISGADELESTVNPTNVPATCARCHANATVMAKHDLERNVVKTFQTSFHGSKRLLGDERAAICTSCHGVHDIRAHDHPLSTVNPSNVASTCGTCHKGATAAFASSFTHTLPESATAPVVYWVGQLYFLALYGTIGLMLLYVVLDIYRRRQSRRHP